MQRTLVMSAALSGLIRHLYIDNEPHELMARLNSIRIWKNIETAAESMRLSTRLTMGKGIDFERFEELEDFTMSHVRNFVQQDAREIGKNLLVIQLLRLLMAMIQMGFVTTFELVPMLPVLLGILDGREDVVGENAEAEERYQIKRNKKVDTLVLMECKLVVCEILQLVCTIRLDVRLSQLLDIYRQEPLTPQPQTLILIFSLCPPLALSLSLPPPPHPYPYPYPSPHPYPYPSPIPTLVSTLP